MLITVANEKGGVGKTTLVLHLAHACAEAGKRALVIDMDTQGNASQLLSRDPLTIARRPGGAETLLTSVPATEETIIPGVDLLHGHRGLEALDSAKLPEIAALGDVIRGLGYDIVIVDTPPGFGPRHVAPLMWADRILVPLEPSISSIAGIAAVQETLAAVMTTRPNLEVLYLVNRMLPRSRAHRDVVKELSSGLGGSLFGVLTLRVSVADALADGKPVWRVARDVELRKLWLETCTQILGIKLRKGRQ